MVTPGLASRGRALIDQCGQTGLAIMVSQGLRTWEEKDAPARRTSR